MGNRDLSQPYVGVPVELDLFIELGEILRRVKRVDRSSLLAIIHAVLACRKNVQDDCIGVPWRYFSQRGLVRADRPNSGAHKARIREYLNRLVEWIEVVEDDVAVKGLKGSEMGLVLRLKGVFRLRASQAESLSREKVISTGKFLGYSDDQIEIELKRHGYEP